jgi:hypothetical protein
MRGRLEDISGMKFGKWTVVDGPHSGKYPGAWWGAVCECGGKHVIYGRNLKNGQSTQCRACKKSNQKTHGAVSSRLYKIWVSMKRRVKGTCSPAAKKTYEHVDLHEAGHGKRLRG